MQRAPKAHRSWGGDEIGNGTKRRPVLKGANQEASEVRDKQGLQ